MALENTTAGTEKETHDFMNVESFSQLPFIRPHAATSSNTGKEKPIRLFGIEFGINSSAAAAAAGEDSSADENNNNEEETSRHIKENESNSSSSSNNNSRRFECHYCCRNFPTSQALGGHQNAHKRERQHAKRAHLHSAGHLADAHHIYGLFNYTAGIGSGPNNITNYPSWTTSNSRLYGAHHHDHQSSSNYFSQAQAQAPINGSPLGLLRIPGASSVQSRHLSFNRDRPLLQHQQQNPLPLFGSSLDRQVVFGGSSSKTMQSSRSSSSRFLFHETKPSSHDHVSLDLHL